MLTDYQIQSSWQPRSDPRKEVTEQKLYGVYPGPQDTTRRRDRSCIRKFPRLSCRAAVLTSHGTVLAVQCGVSAEQTRLTCSRSSSKHEVDRAVPFR